MTGKKFTGPCRKQAPICRKQAPANIYGFVMRRRQNWIKTTADRDKYELDLSCKKRMSKGVDNATFDVFLSRF